MGQNITKSYLEGRRAVAIFGLLKKKCAKAEKQDRVPVSQGGKESGGVQSMSFTGKRKVPQFTVRKNSFFHQEKVPGQC